jgi:ABC-type transport system involved in multi-copper enzyme maturation permease subunit
MDIFLEPLVGPLAAIECRRSLSRAWVLVIRGLAAVPPALVLLAVLWLWWFQRQFIRGYSPAVALVWGLMVVEAMFVTVALLLGQALLAGTLAGEKLRSTSALLAARVSSLEIVLGRLAGRLCVVAIVVAAGLPILVWLAALCELGPIALATLIALPAAVAFGGGGLALAVSAVTRTGRDALLVVYLFQSLLLLAPLLGGGLSAPMRQWIEPLNPYQGIRPLAELRDPGPALVTMGLWTFLGAAGCAWAAWRLRPAFLNAMDGPRRRWRLFRPTFGPTLANQPMLWKEVSVEQGQAFSRVVKWLGILVVAVFSGTSLALAGLVARETWFEADPDGSSSALYYLKDWLAWSWLMAWLLQWALGLRAAAAITSERQRGTWDALLVSPLEAREILWAKIYGSIHGLRGMLAAVILAWAAGLLCGALDVGAFAELLAQTLVIGSFMVAIGIAFSLYCESSTRAMTGTIIGWLAAGCVFVVLAGILTLMVMLAWLFWNLLHGMPPAGAGPGVWPVIVYQVIRFTFYGLTALLTAVFIPYYFDVLAGRSAAADSPLRVTPAD